MPYPDSGSGRDGLAKQTREDASLTKCRTFVSQCLHVYKWHNGLILKDTSNELGEMKTVLVVPNNCRKQIMSIAHNNLGYFSYKKTLAVIKRHFSWPNMLSDIKSFAELAYSVSASTLVVCFMLLW